MRSTICISLCLALAGMAEAADFRHQDGFVVGTELGYRLGPRLGCYQRLWSPQELQKSPGQVMEGVRVKVFQDLSRADHPAGAGVFMRVIVKAADQGQARTRGLGGVYFYDEFECTAGYKQPFPFCFSYCEGGRMIFPRLDPDAMVFTIDQWMMVRDETQQCGSALSMTGWRDGRFSYRLDRVDDAICENM